MSLSVLLQSFGYLDLFTLFIMVLATFIGMIVGALPGLGTVTALAMMLPFTYALTAPQAIGMLLAVYVSSVYGGSIPALLINVPGTPQSAATTFDGYPMAKKGQVAEALGWTTAASTFGGIFSMIVLMFAAPQLAAVAIRFGSIETFALIVFSLTTIAWVSKGNPLKGLLAGIFGVFLATIGVDEMSGTYRFTFDVFSLSAGFHIVPILIGLFAVSEIFAAAGDREKETKQPLLSTGFKLAPWKEWSARKGTLLRSSVIGTFLGILPGVGATAASLISYGEARGRSKRKENFGEGEPEGLVASEAANNAVTGGALVPTLALGIPGDAATAVMLGALIIHGITPGVQLFDRNPNLVSFIFVALLVCNVMMFFAGIAGAQIFSRVLKLPHSLIMGVVTSLALAGSYVIRLSMLDVVVCLVAGVVGVLLRYANVPLAPVVIGFILGKPLETNLRQGLILTDMNPLGFFHSWIADIFFAITAIVVLWPLLKRFIRRPGQRS